MQEINNYSPTKTGKANFTINQVSDLKINNDEFVMMTIRTHDQYNTTIYGLDDRYRGILNERRVILMNEEDMKDRGLQKMDKVNLISHFDGEQRIAKGFLVVPFSIPRQCTATYFPEANVLVSHQKCSKNKQYPSIKSCHYYYRESIMRIKLFLVSIFCFAFSFAQEKNSREKSAKYILRDRLIYPLICH